jgi:hypothetical protein
VSGPAPVARRSSLAPTVAAGALALITTLIAWAFAGATLGLVIATLTFITVIIAPLTGAAPRSALPTAASAVLTTATVWIFGFGSPIGLATTFKMLLVLATFAFAVSGVVLLLVRARFDSTLASTAAVIVMLAWLSWPVWLSGHLSEGRLLSALVVAHPIFAINGASESFGVWTQQHLMYRLTALGQDVAFTLPRSVMPCVLTQAFLGALGIVPQFNPGRRLS